VKSISPVTGGRTPIAGHPLPFFQAPFASRTWLAQPPGLRSTLHAPRSTLHAFTLVEILVTIALLAFITLGLFAALDQVQRAFRSGMGQVDRLEAGRAVTELLPRELEQTTPCDGNAVTFVTQIIPNSAPLTQSLPGMPATMMRTNLLEDCFILTRQNQTWVGIGYCVRASDANGLALSLLRFHQRAHEQWPPVQPGPALC
jgi:hypothetical protein